MSSANWRVIEKAGRSKYRDATLLGVCAALSWTPDSIDRILAGQPPRPLEESAPGVPESTTDASGDTVAILEEVASLTAELAQRARDGRL